MSLYQCDECGCCENTALVNYWAAVYKKDKKRCSECSTGKWHGRFDKVMLPMGMFVTNSAGNLAHKETGDTDFRKYELPKDSKHD